MVRIQINSIDLPKLTSISIDPAIRNNITRTVHGHIGSKEPNTDNGQVEASKKAEEPDTGSGQIEGKEFQII
jgi:hypothetical protein